MTTSLQVWDRKAGPPDGVGEVLYWQSFAQRGGTSVPLYLENNAERLRAKYLAFIHDLGETRIGSKQLVEHLALSDGFSFWWMTQLAEKSPFKSPRIYTCLRLLALEEILRDRKPPELGLVSSDRDLAQAIRALCVNLRIRFEWQDSGKPKRKLSVWGIYRALPYPLQGLISFVRYLFGRWAVRLFQRPQWFSGEGAVFLCSFFAHLDPVSCAQGDFHSRQWGALPKLLYDGGRRTNWVHHFLLSPEVPDTRTGLCWLRGFNADADRQGAHVFLDSYLTLGLVLRALRSWAQLTVVCWRLRNIQAVFSPQGSATWLWPVLRDDWRISTTGSIAIRNCFWVELFDAALKDIPLQKNGFYLCENQDWERALLWAWRKYDHGKIVGVAHATVPFWHLYYFADPRSLCRERKYAMPLPDLLAVNGPGAWKLLAESGYPIERLVEVEALRYLDLPRTASKRVWDPARKKVLILGDIIPASMHNLLVTLTNAIKYLPSGWRFTFKPHPIYPVKLADYPGLENVDQRNEALDRILDEYDVVLAANSTSAAVDAYLAGLPVVIGLDGSNLNLSPLRGQPGVHFFGTSEELTEAFRATGENPAAKSDRAELFFLDSKLPRWRQLLF